MLQFSQQRIEWFLFPLCNNKCLQIFAAGPGTFARSLCSFSSKFKKKPSKQKQAEKSQWLYLLVLKPRRASFLRGEIILGAVPDCLRAAFPVAGSPLPHLPPTCTHSLESHVAAQSRKQKRKCLGMLRPQRKELGSRRVTKQQPQAGWQNSHFCADRCEPLLLVGTFHNHHFKAGKWHKKQIHISKWVSDLSQTNHQAGWHLPPGGYTHNSQPHTPKDSPRLWGTESPTSAQQSSAF